MMPTIFLDYDDRSFSIILTGEIQKLISHRFAFRYLNDYYSPEVTPDSINIPVDPNTLERSIQKIREMLKKYGFLENRSSNLEKILSDFFNEENKFTIFAEKALKIRNNECETSDFKEFTNALVEYLPFRSLYELQLLSAYHLAFAQNACNFSVPGAGKTSIVYGAYSYLKHLQKEDIKRIDKLLIIGPLSSFGPWEQEYAECFGNSANSTRLLSTMSKNDKSDYLISDFTSELTLISYASVTSLQDDLIIFLRRNKVMVVLDEAHKIKNTSGGITATSVLSLARYCSARVILTGTPAPNGYEDLSNLYSFIWPLKNIIKFPVNQLRMMSQNSNDSRIEKVVDNISPFFIRIKKSDLGIPEPINNNPILEPMGNYQRKIYEYIENKYISSLVEDQNSLASTFKQTLVNAKLIRLMQAATNPAMLMKPLKDFIIDEGILQEDLGKLDDQNIIQEILKFEQLETPSKFIRVKELVENLISTGEKVIIWATFIQTILDLRLFLEKNNIPCEVLYGAIPVEKENDREQEAAEITREKIIRHFHKPDSSFKVIIANPYAVGESISLHKCCHNAIYIEKTFNAGHFMQSKDRIHRYGLKENDKINYYHVLSENSIDETIHQRVIQKEKKMVEVMESMPIPLFKNISDDLGDDDIRAIIKDYVRRTTAS